MALQHTPPGRFASDTDIPASLYEKDVFPNFRKRRQPHHDIIDFEDKFNSQLSMWDRKITDCVSKAVCSSVSCEMASISSKLIEINSNIVELKTDNINIRKSVDETNQRLSEMEKALNFSIERQESFDGRLKKVEENMTQASDINAQVQALELKLALMEQQARQCNIEISNLPERRNENLIGVLNSLGNYIKQPINPVDIVSVHRVPHADPSSRRPKNVVVKLSNRILRDNIISACRAVK
ncbi:uncharacterized protein LOC106133093 [Amyelois transitella]|uniref:uncharacterized protein LOC106133093 n=1 Tax=Amyelois transitella TaxID=680683 RepID=UPI00298F9CF5|nr:uncharacterized protein LOC106133093 [Amyelois transitella]